MISDAWQVEMKTFEAGDEILKEGEATKEALTMCRKCSREVAQHLPLQSLQSMDVVQVVETQVELLTVFPAAVGADPLHRRSTILAGC